MAPDQASEILIDGTYFTFPAGMDIEVFDELDQYKAATGKLPIMGCDVLAVQRTTMWIIEMKDYTFPDASVPTDIAEVCGRKAMGTMSLVFAHSKSPSDGRMQSLSRRCADTSEVVFALHVEVKDGGRKAQEVLAVQAALKDKIQSVLKCLGVRKVYVTSSLAPARGVEWTSRSDPRTRSKHQGR